MKKYEQIDISGDVGLRVWGGSMEELFTNAAEGMFDLITDTTDRGEVEKKTIILRSDNLDNLFVLWLNELIFLFDTYGFIGKDFDLTIQDSKIHDLNTLSSEEGSLSLELKAAVSGTLFNPQTCESRLLIKAATYHDLLIKNTGSFWEAVVIFDI